MANPLRKGAEFTVQARIVILLSVLAVIFLVYLGWSAKNEQRQIAAFLKDRDNQFSTHFSQTLNLFQKPLHIVAYEYSLWDEMVDFVQNKDRVWARENIDFLIRQYGLTAAWVFDAERAPVYRVHSAEARGDNLGFSENMQQRLFSSRYACHFFLPTDQGLLEVFGAKIQPSGDNLRTSPARGYLFVGRLWDKKVAAELGSLTGSVVAVTAVKEGMAPGTDCIAKREKDVFTLIQPLLDWEEKPVACLSVRNETTIPPGLQASGDREFLVATVFVCFTLLLLFVCLWVWVNKPLAAISKSLNEQDSHGILRLSESRTEFGQISRLIDRFFIDRKNIVEEVERRKEAEAHLRNAGEELERRVAERTRALSRSNLLLRSLASQLLLAEERERRRIADDLHDHIGQILVLAKLRVQQVKELVNNPEPHSLLDEIQMLVAETLAYSRSLTAQLSPPVLREFGFEAAVKSLASEFERENNIPVALEDDTATRVQDDQIAVLLYRSVRELLANVAKHSQATAVKIRLTTYGDRIEAVIEDNGIGFIPDLVSDINKNIRFGLFSIKERLTYLGGEMKIESEPRKGTRVFLFVPAVLAEKGLERREEREHEDSSS